MLTFATVVTRRAAANPGPRARHCPVNPARHHGEDHTGPERRTIPLAAVRRHTIRAFHGTVLGSGGVPLGVLEQLVTGWVRRGAG